MEELASLASRQADLLAHARAQMALVAESSRARHEEEISSLTAQLASVKAALASSEAEQLSSKAKLEQAEALAEKMADEKIAAVLALEKECAAVRERDARAAWALGHLEQAKDQHLANIDKIGQRCQEKLNAAEEKLRKLSIEYDEELYPHLVQSVAERRWLIANGLRLAAMGVLEHPDITTAFGKVVNCAVAHGMTLAISELAQSRSLKVAPADVPSFNADAPVQLKAAMQELKTLELPHIGQLERDQDQPINVIFAGLTLPRHLGEGAEQQPDFYLKPDVSQLKVRSKKGIKGKAIMCGIGAAHQPRSDGVPVMVAIVSLDDAALLQCLEESKEAAVAESSSPLRRTYSI